MSKTETDGVGSGEDKLYQTLRTRLEMRKFPEDLPRIIFDKADRRYRDRETDHFIAIKTGQAQEAGEGGHDSLRQNRGGD